MTSGRSDTSGWRASENWGWKTAGYLRWPRRRWPNYARRRDWRGRRLSTWRGLTRLRCCCSMQRLACPIRSAARIRCCAAAGRTVLLGWRRQAADPGIAMDPASGSPRRARALAQGRRVRWDERDADFANAVAGLVRVILEHGPGEASIDRLTGLPNRPYFLGEVNRHIDRLEQDGTSGTMLLIDLDGLRRVNAAHGRALGDDLLIRTANLLRGIVRPVDMVAPRRRRRVCGMARQYGSHDSGRARGWPGGTTPRVAGGRVSGNRPTRNRADGNDVVGRHRQPAYSATARMLVHCCAAPIKRCGTPSDRRRRLGGYRARSGGRSRSGSATVLR